MSNTTFPTGCRISDQIADCAVGAGNHGGFVSCVAHLTNDLKKSGVISGSDKGAIQSCAGHASHVTQVPSAPRDLQGRRHDAGLFPSQDTGSGGKLKK